MKFTVFTTLKKDKILFPEINTEEGAIIGKY